jgi:hypothetical protein
MLGMDAWEGDDDDICAWELGSILMGTPFWVLMIVRSRSGRSCTGLGSTYPHLLSLWSGAG